MFTSNEVEARLNTWKQRGDSKAQLIRELAESCLDWPYVYASNGEMCTPEWRRNRMGVSDEKYANAIKTACPVQSGSASSCVGCKWNGMRCFDCQGFVHWLLTQAEVPYYGGGATTQWNTTSNWVIKGETKNIPHGLVACVFKYKEGKMSHTGMYQGNEQIIHCSTIVKRGTLNDYPAWTHWGIPAGLYSNEELRAAGLNIDESKNIPTLRQGTICGEVKKLQEILNEKVNANLTVDGNFGAKTTEAVKLFQKKNGLTADGVVGPKTRAVLGMSVVETSEYIPAKANTKDNTEVIWNTLYAEIGNAYGVAGVMGNLEAESGLIANNLQNTGNKKLGMTDEEYTAAVDNGSYTAEQFASDGQGYGLAQWTYKTRKAALLNHAKSKGTSVGDLGAQLEYLLKELRAYQAVWNTLTHAASVREASNTVMLDFEKPANQSEENQESRYNRGLRFYELYAPQKASEEGGKTNMSYNAKVTPQSGSTVNMRKSPSLTASVIKAVPGGTIVNVTEEYNDDWAAIQVNGMAGYMMRKYLVKYDNTAADGDMVLVSLPRNLAAELMNYLNKALGG